MHPPQKKIPFTPEGFATLKKEQEELLSKRPQVVAELRRARELGDLKENGAYRGARSHLTQIDSRLRHIAYLLRFAHIEEPKIGMVGVNSFVTVDDGEKERTFHIVGDHEANPIEGKISQTSPIGSKLMGKRVGDKVIASVPAGIITYTIVSIS